jgi:hypothetical protein
MVQHSGFGDQTGGAVPDRRRFNRAMVTASIICATIMQGVDTTIANVALPHIQGSLSCSQDQIAWSNTCFSLR